MYRTADEFAGRTTSCPRCARVLAVPGVLTADEEGDREFALPKNTKIFCRRAMYSFLLGFCSLGLAFFAGIPAVVFGYLGLIEIKHGKGRLRGAGFALMGIVLGLFGTTVTTTTYVVPIVRAVLSFQRDQQCVENLKQIGLALHNYVADNGRFPLPAITDGQGRPLLSWRVAILPYLDQQAGLYRRFHLDEPWDGPNNMALLYQMPEVYMCPEVPVRQKTVYQALIGPGTLFPGDRALRIYDVTAGTSRTTAVVEGPTSVNWSAPEEIDVSDPNYSGMRGVQHDGGSHALNADGSVR